MRCYIPFSPQVAFGSGFIKEANRAKTGIRNVEYFVLFWAEIMRLWNFGLEKTVSELNELL